MDCPSKPKLKPCILAFCLSLLVSGCAGVPHRATVESPQQKQLTGVLSGDSSQAIQAIEADIQNEDSQIEVPAATSTAAPTAAPTSKKRKIPIEVNERVLKWIRYFTTDARDRFGRFLDRGAKYKPLVQKILRENGVPPELYYLGLIESGYTLNARSRAYAVGAWQFVRSTGLLYGLKQNYYLDERRDIIRSTQAAAHLLKNLYGDFHSWYLAMAAYNAGEGRILHAIARGRTHDFWALVRKRVLPIETRNYVPKFLAAAIIGRHPEVYGFDRSTTDSLPQVAAAEVPGGVRLRDVATRIGVTTRKLQQLNPHLLRSLTPAYLKTYPIWVPQEKVAQVEKIRPILAKMRITRVIASYRPLIHRVRPGETLGLIAERLHTTVSALRRMNDLRSSRIRIGQPLRVRYRVRYGVKPHIVHYRPEAGFHRVRPGETLSRIAARWHTSVRTLRRINHLRSARIRAGERLRVESAVYRPSSSRQGYHRVFHRVRRGEALELIAHRYHVPIGRLKRMNSLHSSRIYPGQRLLVSWHGSADSAD